MCILLALMIMMLSVSCSSITMPSDVSDARAVETIVILDDESQIQSYKEHALKIYDLIDDGHFGFVHENMINEAVRSHIDEDDFIETFEVLEDICGKSVREHDVVRTVTDGTDFYTVLDHRENATIKVSFSFDFDYDVVSLMLTYSNIIPEITDDEEYLQLGEDGVTASLYDCGHDSDCVIFIQGSGPLDFNAAILNCSPFEDISAYLYENGISSIRFNKRFYEYPQYSQIDDITIYTEFMDDLYDAIDYASSNYDGKIILLGYSTGSMALLKAYDDNPEVTALISMAGSPRNPEDISYDQNVRLMDAAGYEYHAKRIQEEALDSQRKAIRNLSEDDGRNYLGIPSSWWLSSRDFDTLERSLDTEAPIMLMQGTNDAQITLEDDFMLWKNLLSDDENAVFRVYDGLDHNFSPSLTKDISSVFIEKKEPSHVDEKVLEDIVDYINQ